MYSTFPQAEKQPLISNNEAGYGNTVSKEAETPTYPWKLKAIIFTLLIVAAFVVYEIFPRNHHHHNLAGGPSFGHHWVTLESSPKANQAPKQWTKLSECDDSKEFTLTLAVKQQNTDKLHDHVMSVSDPKSDQFHQFWTSDQVREYFAPSKESVDTVMTWLESSDILKSQIEMSSEYGNVIRVNINCGTANKLLNTKYVEWEHKDSGKKHLRVENGAYSIPGSIQQHLDFISPTFRFPLRKHTKSIELISNERLEHLMEHNTRAGRKKAGYQPVESHLNMDDTTINTPSELKSLYGMDDTMAAILDGETTETMKASTSRQAIASFIEEYYEDSDLELFWEYFDLDPTSTMERVPATQEEGYGSEAELDTQYISATGQGIYTYVFYEDGDEIFVELAEAILEESNTPTVVSISYGADEYELGESYVTRCNTEFGKLALVGCSVFASSGDSGVLGNDDTCFSGSVADQLSDADSDTTSELNSEARSKTTSDYSYISSFPAAALYVTTVGGTTDGEVTTSDTTSTNEIAWVDSGGGFSLYFDRPTYQDNAVLNYYANTDIDINMDRFAESGAAYPDVSVQSVYYVIAYESAFYLVSGTSCSSPTFAGMISMINFAREKAGMTALGFINPALYALYDEGESDYYFNDVISGYNVGCSVDSDIGFSTAVGWDPITGLGTAKFDNLYTAFMSMD